ncbi:MAG: UTRA domain-containing protein [Chloroflexi bacterium]|nr:UTRA domain-containing protein [Chloroflexota bacterium]
MPNKAMIYEVDKSSAVPLYIQLASWIEAKITTGEWPPNYRLPGEIELAKQFGVSRGSLRKAIALLIGRNLLVQIHGRGTFVSPFIFEQTWAGRLTGVSEELLLLGIPFVTEVLNNQIIPAPQKEAQTLALERGEPVIYLQRLRRVTNGPIVLHESFFPANKYGDLLTVDFTKESLMETLERLYGIRLAWASHTIAVIRANARIANLLEINIGSPIFYDEHTVYDSNNNIVELSKGWFRSDRFRLKTVVRRGPNEPFYSALGHINSETEDKEPVAPNHLAEPFLASEKLPSLIDLLPPERIALKVKVDNWESAVRVVGQLMVKTDGVEPRYIDAMIDMAKQLGPYIVVAPGVAMPHALPQDGVRQPCLALATLDIPILFGNPNNDPVKVILAIGAVDTVQHINALRDFARILSDPANLEALYRAKSKEEIIGILGIVSAND